MKKPLVYHNVKNGTIMIHDYLIWLMIAVAMLAIVSGGAALLVFIWFVTRI